MTGLYNKYEVRRVDGKDGAGGPKENAEYFVLDLTHDPHAKAAIAAYIQSLDNTGQFPELADGLRDRYIFGFRSSNE